MTNPGESGDPEPPFQSSSGATSSPNRRPFIITLGFVAVALAIAAFVLPESSSLFAILSALVGVFLAVLAIGGENYLKAEISRRRQDAIAADIEIDRLSWQDASTGLFSFSWFQQALEREISRSLRYEHALSVIWLELDIDHLNTQSPRASSTDSAYIWRFVADLASAAVRDTDTVARRPGEYAVALLLPQSDTDGGNIVVNRLNERLTQEKLELADGTRADVVFKHKVVSYPVDGATVQELLEAARL